MGEAEAAGLKPGWYHVKLRCIVVKEEIQITHPLSRNIEFEVVTTVIDLRRMSILHEGNVPRFSFLEKGLE